jgi:SRSO17 transposase
VRTECTTLIVAADAARGLLAQRGVHTLLGLLEAVGHRQVVGLGAVAGQQLLRVRHDTLERQGSSARTTPSGKPVEAHTITSSKKRENEPEAGTSACGAPGPSGC